MFVCDGGAAVGGGGVVAVEEEVCRVFRMRVLSLRGVRARKGIEREMEFECSPVTTDSVF